MTNDLIAAPTWRQRLRVCFDPDPRRSAAVERANAWWIERPSEQDLELIGDRALEVLRDALAFARLRLDDMKLGRATLDEKASTLFNLAATFAVAVIAGALQFKIPLAWYAPSLGCFLVGIFTCLWVRMPIKDTGPTTVRDLMVYAPGWDRLLAELRATFVASESNKFVNHWKAARVMAATGAVAVGVLLMILLPLA